MEDTMRADESTAMQKARRFIVERPELPLSVLLLIVVVGGWELIVWGLKVPEIVVPRPSAVAVALWQAIQSPEFLYDFWITLYETLAGFGLGGGGGLVLGILIGQFRLLEKTLYPYVVAFQTVPKVAIAPIIVIWFGFGVTSKIVITATIAFFPVLANTIVGLRATPADQIELLVACTATRWQIFWKVKIFQALPYIFVGLNIAIVMSVIGAIVGEFVGAQAGLGHLIMQSNYTMDMAAVFAILVVLSLMGLCLHGIMQWLQRHLIFWMDSSHDQIVGA